MTRAIVAALLLLTVSLPASALGWENSTAFVFSEKDDPDLIACNVSSSGAVAAVESALRYNRIPISEGNIENRITFYVNINGIKKAGLCVASIELRVFSRPSLPSGIVGMTHGKGTHIYADVLLCTKGELVSGPPDYVGRTVTDESRTFTEQCISEVEKIKEY